MSQATFGPDLEEIDLLAFIGYAAWLEDQRLKEVSLQRPTLEKWENQGKDVYQNQRMELWWKNAILGQDQLRQRVAWALSQIFVISDVAGTLESDPIGMGEYYDILARGALGNYRELLEQVTLSPQMGRYLSMLKNQKADPENNIRPDENYAREVMQLFSIGLVMLNTDGTPQTDGNGATLPTYDQAVVEGFAAAFTGWNYADADSWNWPEENYLPMENWLDYHDQEQKLVLQGSTLPVLQTGEQDLEAALDSIFYHPNVGPFLARRLIQRLVTSNPSPAYVGRVAAVFNDDGSGERGDLYETVRAILMDDEARNGQLADPIHFGKLREPILRQTALWRAFHAEASNGKYQVWNPESDFGQAPLRSPSVFNFYSPFYAPPGEISDAGLTAPEFQITTHSLITSTTNEFYDLIFHGYKGWPNADSNDVLLKISEEKQLAADPAALVDRLDLLLMSNSMSQEMRTLLIDYLNDVDLDDGTQRVLEAVYLICTSAQCAVQQ